MCYLEYFISQLMANAKERYIRTNLEYQEIDCYINRNQEQLEKIMDNILSKEDKVFLQEYMYQQRYQETSINEHLYMEGYRGCIRLLKEIGIIA